MARIGLADAQARASTVDHDRISATTEDDIRWDMAEEGYDPDAPAPEAVRASYPPRFVRERCGLTRARFAAWMGVPVETWRQWELGSIGPDPAVNTLLTLLAREPEAARRSLGSAA